MMICYHCHPVGHVKTNSPQLAAKSAQGSMPATVRIRDGRPVNVEPPKAQVRAFQLMAEEAKAAPNVVTSTFLFYVSIIVIVLCLWIVPAIWYVSSKFLAFFGFILLGSESVIRISDFQ